MSQAKGGDSCGSNTRRQEGARSLGAGRRPVSGGTKAQRIPGSSEGPCDSEEHRQTLGGSGAEEGWPDGFWEHRSGS